MAVSTELQPIIKALIDSNKDAADKIILNENKTAESIKEKLEAVDKDGNRKIVGALRDSLEFEQKQIEETQKNRKIAEASVNLEKQNIELMKQANAKVQKTIEDNGGKVEDNTGFLQNQVEIAKAELDLRKKQLSDPTQAQLLSIGKDELNLEKLRFQAEGKRAEDNLDFQKRTNELRKAEARDRLQQEGLSASARKEASKDLRTAQIEGLKLALDPVLSPLQTVAGFINKGIGKIIPGFTFGRLAGLVGIGLLIKFLRSDIFDDIISALVDFDVKGIGEKIKDTFVSLSSALAAVVTLVGGLAARLLLSTGLGATVAGTKLATTKLTAKDIGIKQDELIKDKSGKTFKLTKGGDLRQFDTAKGKFVGGAVNQDKLLRSLASEGALGERGKLVTGGGGKFVRVLKGIAKRVPGIAQFLALQDIFSLLIGGGEPKEIFPQLVGILTGLGGGALGAILGGLIGGIGSPFTFGLSGFIGSVGGGILGYLGGEAAGKSLAEGIAEIALGLPVKSFPTFDIGPFKGVDINKVFTKGETPGQSVRELVETGDLGAIRAEVQEAQSELKFLESQPETLSTSFTVQKQKEELRKIISEGLKILEVEGGGMQGIVPKGSINFGKMLTPSAMSMSSLQSAENATLLAKNATLRSETFEGGGSVAVVNAVTNNDNKQASNFFPMNVVERPQGFVKDATNALLA